VTEPIEVMLRDHHILVVEDDALVGVSLVDYLEELGAKVLWATNVENALRFVDGADLLHIAIVDLNLDGEMSYPVLDRLLANGVYTILCTGYEASSIDDRFKHLPRCEKPFTRLKINGLLRAGTHISNAVNS
jgi:DNA-binding response OmpR family regulator